MGKLGHGMSEGTAVMSFGQYRGCSISEIPDSYLKWLSETDWFEKKYPKLQEAINAELAYRYDTGSELE
jgi:uncharacterized protein (DUF3820 family)